MVIYGGTDIAALLAGVSDILSLPFFLQLGVSLIGTGR